MGLLWAVYGYYRIPPPLLSTILIEVLLVAALLRARSAAS